MDAATELTGTYLQRVLRWWAGKGPAANAQRRGAVLSPRQTVGWLFCLNPCTTTILSGTCNQAADRSFTTHDPQARAAKMAR
ncbi:hypothetical protein XAP3CFBP6996_016075 [Xanthomonas citri pv. fuscans CFBP 6996]|nr:hypothetical protein XAP3CFBP6996_016075 [Xanthomonas citri pv. fuscans CFBP 6996]QWN17104.1 hypothetical protein DGN02_15815 [Xanthomonas citri]